MTAPHIDLRGLVRPTLVEMTKREDNPNLAEFLRLIETGAVKLDAIITHRFAFEAATQAYELLSGPDTGKALGVVLAYPASSPPEPKRTTFRSTPPNFCALPKSDEPQA